MSIKHVGFTGTSQCPLTKAQRQSLRVELMRRGPGALHLGDAINADAECYDIAFELSEPGSYEHTFTLIGHPPTNASKRAFKSYDLELPPLPYIERDDAIIAASVEMLACPRLDFREELRSGTWTTIRHTLLANKPVLIIWPNGITTNGAEWYARSGAVKSVLAYLKSRR
jgi:hypothetical protein